MQRFAFSLGDLTGGTAAAVIALPGNVAAGVIAFAPLGPDYAGLGILAGMFSSIVAAPLAALVGAPGMISAPKATTSMAFAGLMTTLLATGRFDMATPEDARLLLALGFGAVLLSGTVQFLLGAFRVGGLVRFMPYPVVAGIRNTTAILLISSQLLPFLGVSSGGWGGLLGDPGRIQPATTLVAVSTALFVWKGGRWFGKATVPLLALVVGSLVYHGIAVLIPGARLGPLLGAVSSGLPRPEYVESVFGALTDPANFGVFAAVVSGALAMAILDSISAMISLVTYQSIADRRFDANRQLLGQGLGSAVAAVFGGLTTSGILARTVINHSAGGRSRASGVVNGIAVLVFLLLLTRPLAMLPKAAIAGLIVVIAAGLADRWSFTQIRETLRRDATDRRDNLLAVVQMLFVVLVGVVWGLVAAVGAGVALSVMVFVAQMSRSPIRRIRTGATVQSSKSRDPETARLLAEKGHRIAVLELEGTIFFGSTDALAIQAERLAEEGVDFVIFDMKRVRDVDATGFKVLGQTFNRLRRRGTTLGFSYVTPEVLRPEVAEDLMLNGVPEARMFESTDQALEYFEEGLLLKLGTDEFDEEGWTLDAFGAEWGLDARECEVLKGYVVERFFDAAEYLFVEGDAGRSLFMLRHGAAEVSVAIPGQARTYRLGTVTRGTVVGEMALFDGSPRSATVQVTEPVTAYELSHDSFRRLVREHPMLAIRVQTAIGRIISMRQRRSNALVVELDS